MGQALYRKYRSRSFAEVVGQDHITKTLETAVRTDKISHAYLFTGPRGVGKTSVARILAHEVNGIKYKDESLKLDIIEIDAASNRRIDEIRDLREKVHVAPALLKYKVYIIDEAHMLTREAFNALLKTLEEPPQHCIFILATTEAHKLPETIVSRTQRFNFKPIEETVAVPHLKKIARKEGIKIDEESLKLMASHADGSIRDSIGMLDQIATKGRVTSQKDVRQLLGLPPLNAAEHLIQYTYGGQPAQVLRVLQQLREQGVSASQVANQLSQILRQTIVKEESVRPWQSNLLKELLEVSASSKPSDYLEICLLEAASENQAKDSGVKNLRQPATAKLTVSPPSPKLAMATRPFQDTSRKRAGSTQPKPNAFELSKWPVVLERVKTEAASLYTALRLAEVRPDGQKITLAFQFPLHQKKINQSQNLKRIEGIISEVTGVNVILKCTVDKASEHASDSLEVIGAGTEDLSQNSQGLEAISNIFGPAEMLES